MRIHQKGSEKKYWWENQRFHCAKCDCVFELELADASKVTSKKLQIMVDCPTCKTTLKASKPSLPVQQSVFDEVFGKGGVFERVFGK